MSANRLIRPLLCLSLCGLLPTSAWSDLVESGSVQPSNFTLFDTKWDPGAGTASFIDPNAPPGTDGGTTWSIMDVGTPDAGTLDPHPSTSTSVFDLVAGDEVAIFDAVLDVWDSVSGFTNLGQVSDGGGVPGDDAGGNSDVGDIRIGAYEIDDAFGVLAHAFQPGVDGMFGHPDGGTGGTIGGDTHFDNAENWVDDPNASAGEIDLFTVALHEFGHALGLRHSDDPNAVMFASYSGPRRTLGSDDIAGIQAIYGIELAAVPEPSSALLLGLVGITGIVWRKRRAFAPASRA